MVNCDIGRVAFVGAGPGAPDLITVRGLRLLKQADVVIHDALPGDALLEEIPATTKIVPVGKRCGVHSMTQDEINAVIVREARQGGLIVRLKGAIRASSAVLAKRWIILPRMAFLLKSCRVLLPRRLPARMPRFR